MFGPWIRQRIRNSSLRAKATLITSLVTAAAVTLQCTAYLVGAWYEMRGSSLRDVSSMADIAGGNCTAALVFSDVKAVEETLGGLFADEDILAAAVFGKDGDCFAKRVRAGANVRVPTSAAAPGHRFAEGRMALWRWIHLDRQWIGTIWILHDSGYLRKEFAKAAMIAIALMAASLIAAVVLAARLQGVVTAPVMDLVSAARPSPPRRTTPSEPENTPTTNWER